ncbi:UDP-N-acetylmuramoyl-L-alanine--D-glutamate ligase [Rhizobacter sp. J219]|uniref:UDP-N-acetylmuramoyl-L-alanine--D-glutamate ligase n=1 Tax=Rhizobacter sp. J219 TaxID=2898430 RepID=UPI0021516578|nr:UDP-N-acetylmuramoyl-L-alanine--D-glutamate ligase [Rhizobacter sp. J219]MCR5885682.1 UDP-N-acetylmuramoyl-L-alanine--D-glutamate ligase [Rhizobacter sp. J219]
MKHLKDAHVLVLGLGESGLAMARWCADHGARVRVWDSRETAPQDVALAAQVPSAERLSGTLDVALLREGVQLVLKSPGLAPGDERIAPLLTLARETGVPVQGELDLFARALADLKAERGYAPKVIAITGTNGKTTTTSMTGQLVERTGKRVAVAGNIGPTMLQTLADALALEPAPAADVPSVEPMAEATPETLAAPAPGEPADAVPDAPVMEPPSPVDDDAVAAETETLGAQEIPADAEAAALTAEPAAVPTADVAAVEPPAADDETAGGGPPPHLIPPPPPGPVFEHLPEVWVLGLSSFQLDGVQGFEPSAATVLNVTQDHLDWHGSMEAYAAAKARIFGKNAVMVINRDDPLVEKMIPAPIPGKGRFAKPIERHVVRFGLDAPQRPGDFGVLVENGIAWLVRAMESDETAVKKPKKGAAVEEEELVIQRLMPADALRVRGRHNAANALAALALATAAGCPLAPMLHGLREYAGEPHRVEFVATVNGVEAYDDSKGTNVGATVAALNGLGDDKAPSKLVVILGGDGKGQDFTPLATPVQRHVRAVATIGRDAEAIEQVLRFTGVPVQRHGSLEEATRWAFQRAHAGDAVLLSPACASLDMFRNYAHRAEVFVAEVQAIASAGGEVV